MQCARVRAGVAWLAIGRKCHRHGHQRVECPPQGRRHLQRIECVVVILDLEQHPIRVQPTRGDETRTRLTHQRALHSASHLRELDWARKGDRVRTVADERSSGAARCTQPEEDDADRIPQLDHVEWSEMCLFNETKKNTDDSDHQGRRGWRGWLGGMGGVGGVGWRGSAWVGMGRRGRRGRWERHGRCSATCFNTPTRSRRLPGSTRSRARCPIKPRQRSRISTHSRAASCRGAPWM